MISAPDISFGSGSKPTLAFVFVIFVLLPILIGLGCDNKSSTEQNQEATFVANDTIRNLPIPAQVKAVNPDSLAKPKTVPLLREPKVVPARSNLFTAPPPTVLPGPANLTIVTPGENGIPLPDTISMVKEEGIIRHPGPAPAGPLGMKPEAITDIRYLSVSQGLMGTFVSDIIEDRNGNLWFIGEEYLSRYDGKSLIHYTPKDGFGLDEFGFLMEDSRGNLWLGGSGRICRYNGRHVTRFIMEGEFKYAAVISMMEDQGGNLWFGTRQGVIKYEPSANSGQGSFVKYTIREGLIHRVVHSMLEDRRGRLWFGTGFGLSCYDGKRFTNYAIEEDLDVRSMLEDRQGVFWLGTDLGLIRFDPSANAGPGIFAKINVEMGNRIEALTEDRNGNIWVASYRDGLFCLIRDENGVGKKYLRYTEREGLSGNYFRSMLMDSHGNIWIGGQNGGATRINNRNPIRYINQETGVKGKTAMDIYGLD
jgi:streptogramin lyase